MSALTLDHILTLLEDYVRQTGRPLDVLLIGRLALYAYGIHEARTDDMDAELAQDVEEVGAFLKRHGVPSNLSENISGWSIVSLPPGYRVRARVFHGKGNLRVSVLDPTDFVISKLRRGTEQDLADAEFVVRPRIRQLGRRRRIRHCSCFARLLNYSSKGWHLSNQLPGETRSGCARAGIGVFWHAPSIS